MRELIKNGWRQPVSCEISSAKVDKKKDSCKCGSLDSELVGKLSENSRN